MSELKLRVLLMIDEAGVGGGQQHVLWLAQGMNRSEFEVAVACEPTGYLVDELGKSGITHFPLKMSNTPSAGALLAARRLMLKWGVDVVHTHGGTAGATGRLAARTIPGCKIVHTYHGFHYLHGEQGWKRKLYVQADRVLLKITHRTICVAVRDRETGVAAGIVDPAKNSVVLNGIDGDRFACERNYRFSSAPVIGTIGRLHVQKGHRFLIDAMLEILRRMPGAQLVIIGGGSLKNALATQAREQGVEASIEFAGETTDSPAALRGMDLFVLPSLWEGFPIVLLEAMASGLPIVATAVDGVTEMLSDRETGLLVPPQRADLLAGAVDALLRDDALRRRLGEAARADVRARFGVERMVRETEDVYKGVTR
jgi:glycosyltransferase involved in cell wall biosynthesis